MCDSQASAGSSSSHGAAARQARAEALARLQAAGEEWWDQIEVSVPWSAVSAIYHGRDDSWNGYITEATEVDDALQSYYTLEDGLEGDTLICVSGSELAGLVAFGEHGLRIQCAEIDAEVAVAAAGTSTGGAAGAGKRGRPKGAKNKPKAGGGGASGRGRSGADDDEQLDPLGELCLA
jgi:hypothetical protein